MSPAALDPDVVHRHLGALRLALRQLQRHVGQPIEALADLDTAWIVERGLQLCVQNCLDVATHVAVSAGHDVPTYAAAIDHLAVLGVLPGPFAHAFRAIAGFRNVVVHGYLAIDPAVLHDALNQRLGDFAAFAAYVEAYLARPG